MKLNVKSTLYMTAKGLISSACGTYGSVNMNPLLQNFLWLRVNVTAYDFNPCLYLWPVVLCFFHLFLIYMLWQDKHFLSRANIANEIELRG